MWLESAVQNVGLQIGLLGLSPMKQCKIKIMMINFPTIRQLLSYTLKFAGRWLTFVFVVSYNNATGSSFLCVEAPIRGRLPDSKAYLSRGILRALWFVGLYLQSEFSHRLWNLIWRIVYTFSTCYVIWSGSQWPRLFFGHKILIRQPYQ